VTLACIGELLIDFLPLPGSQQTPAFRAHPGGSPMNVAVGLARLGQPTAFIAKVSRDFFGRLLREHLDREGIDPRFLVESDAPTTLAFVTMTDGEPQYAFYGQGAADTLLEAPELGPHLESNVDLLHFGSISLTRGSTPQAVLAAAERLAGRALLSFDPNIRPDWVRDEVAYRSLLDRLFALADIVKVSGADLGWLAPGEVPETAAQRILERGPGLVALTRGSQGATLLRADGCWSVPPVPVEVVDTVGAGDTFDAGLLAALVQRGAASRATLDGLDEQALTSALQYAATAAALACSRPGANPPTRAEVESVLGRAP
jgi:fructokinase